MSDSEIGEDLAIMIFAFCSLAWKFVKKIGEVEKQPGFRDAMSNGNHDNLLLYVSFKVREKCNGLYFEEKEAQVLRLMPDESTFLLHIYSCL